MTKNPSEQVVNTVNELVQNVRTAKTPEEIVEAGKQAGREISAEKAEDLYERLHHQGELSDQELEDVSGGCGGGGTAPSSPAWNICPTCGGVGIMIDDYPAPMYPELVLMQCSSCGAEFFGDISK